MRATCLTKRDDLRGLKKSANHKHPNRSLAKNETFNDTTSLERQNSISSTLITKSNEVASLSCPQHHSNVHYDTLSNANMDKNTNKCCYG